MGSNAIISVLGFIIVFTIVTTTLNKRNTQAYENTYAYVNYTVARDIARNSIQIALRKIDTASVLSSSYFPVTGTLESGTFQVDGVILGANSVRLTARGTFGDTNYTIKTRMDRRQLPLPPSLYKGAFGIYPDATTFNWGGSKDTVSGRDHDIVGNLLPASGDTVPPFQVRTALDSAAVVSGVGTYMNNLIGNPKVWVDPTISNPNITSDDFKWIADSIYTSNVGNEVTIGKGNGSNLGDSSHPVIIFLDGTDKNTGLTDGKFKLSIKDGWGILVVKGDLKFASGVTWHGAVIEYGNTALTFNASAGNAAIVGGMIFGGLDGGTYSLGGNSDVLHSRVALDIFRRRVNPYLYQIVDWYE